MLGLDDDSSIILLSSLAFLDLTVIQEWECFMSRA